MGTHRPCPSPIFWPMVTWSPTATRGWAGAPICWLRGTTAWAGAGRVVMRAGSASSLCPLGWMPPQNKRFISIFSIR